VINGKLNHRDLTLFNQTLYQVKQLLIMNNEFFISFKVIDEAWKIAFHVKFDETPFDDLYVSIKGNTTDNIIEQVRAEHGY
tara:strand:+ start:1021 stop:1263 length:243 start_codon:yes stop_codon:yes gene_type:complete